MKAGEYQNSRYVVLSDEFQTTHRQRVKFFSNDPGMVKAGTWCVDGIPLGGYQVYPMRWLNEEQRQKDCQ